MKVVLDACAIIAYFRDERGGFEVEEILLDPNNECAVHAINLCEVYYDFHRGEGPEEALKVLADLRHLGVVEHTRMDRELWQDAAILKSVHRRVSLADCFAVALARQLGATLVTSDRKEFGPLKEKRVCQVLFIR